jgi:glutathione S-transferase
MKLLGSPASAYARKARIALEEKGIAYEYVIDRPSAPDTRVKEFNPLGQIPVLVCDDGSTVYDSPVIVEYADGLAPPPRLIPEGFADRIAVKRWEALGDGMVDAIVALLLDGRREAGKRQDESFQARQNGKIVRGLATMERTLGQGAFCHGDTFTLADIACGVALGYLDQVFPQRDWRADHPGLARHAERLAARESFRKTFAPPL